MDTPICTRDRRRPRLVRKMPTNIKRSTPEKLKNVCTCKIDRRHFDELVRMTTPERAKRYFLSRLYKSAKVPLNYSLFHIPRC